MKNIIISIDQRLKGNICDPNELNDEWERCMANCVNAMAAL